MARVTLQTIADAVGVSRTTVSNAFSRPDQLTDELRTRILAEAERLDYAGPNPAARTLRRGTAQAVGLLFAEALSYAFADPYAVSFLRGLAEATEEAGVGLLLLPSPPACSAETAVGQAVVDGFCVFSMADGNPAVEAARRRGLPLVIVDMPVLPDAAFVGIDDRAAARAVGEHLVALGHRRVAVVIDRVSDDDVQGPVDEARLASATFRIARERIAGYREAFAAVGLPDLPVVEAIPNSVEAGRRAAASLLDAPDRPTAIAAFSDAMALGVIDAAAARGLRVPEDLSVVGFDDAPPAAPAGLTTVRQPIADKGRAAGRLLVGDAKPDARVVLPTELVVRTTTGPAPRAAGVSSRPPRR